MMEKNECTYLYVNIKHAMLIKHGRMKIKNKINARVKMLVKFYF